MRFDLISPALGIRFRGIREREFIKGKCCVLYIRENKKESTIYHVREREGNTTC